MKTLKLTLSKKPFEVMVTGEKKFEYRKPSKWIKSRLWKLEGYLFPEKKETPVFKPKEYDLIEFTNGYGKNKPRFTAEYMGFMENISPHTITYSNGLEVEIESRDIIIKIGKIITIENYDL